MEEYLVDLNATAAAIRAGYKESTAAQQGHNLLQKPELKKAIQEAKDARSKRTLIDGDYVVLKLKEIADMDAADYKDSRLRFGNKIKALELLGRYLGLFDSKREEIIHETEDDPLSESIKEWMKEHGD